MIQTWLLILLLLLLVVFIWRMLSRRPRHDRDWRPEQSRLPRAIFRGREIGLENIRNCVYRSELDVDVDFYDRTFDLDGLKSVDYVHQPFRGKIIAGHTFLSFGFANGDYLAISIEARRPRRAEYSAVKGFFRSYELIYIAACERDILKLRVNHHKDDVHIYPLRLSQTEGQKLLYDMLEQMNAIYIRPRFYNTLTDTCSYNSVRHISQAAGRPLPGFFSVILPAYVDWLLYRYGLIPADLPFKKLRRRHLINERVVINADHPDFSKKIRIHE